MKPSGRGELEITSVNQKYLKESNLKLQIMSRGYAWLDTGTHEAMSDATEFVKAVERRTSLKIGCIEEVALKMEFIQKDEFEKLIEGQGKSDYGKYLRKITN